MFRSALIKLTGVYLFIIMVISLFFSLNLYRISVNEINNSFNRQQNNVEKRIIGIGPSRIILQDPSFLQERDQILNDGQQHIIWQLVYTNFAILVLGGAISYVLAKVTLRPIEEAHEAQIRFTADASHELRSPLAAIKAENEVALRDPKLSKEEAVEILKSNLEEVEKLSILSEGLLELARDNKEAFEKSSAKVEEFTSMAVANVANKAKEKGIKIEQKVNGFSIVGNKESLTELVTILLDNALKFSERGKRVELRAEKQDSHILLSVIDQGKGIAEKDLPYIFDRFYRAETSRSKNKADGYGLGLSIAKKLAQMNGGEITVQSAVGKGTTFTILLVLA